MNEAADLNGQGATGVGISEKIERAYQFVATNWCMGDEIYVYGFSRGAYAVSGTLARPMF